MADQQQIHLPNVVHFALPAQHAIVIIEALGNHGPHKVVHAVLQNFEQQLLSQRVFPQPAPAPGDGVADVAQAEVIETREVPPVDNDHVAPGCELFDVPDLPQV